MNPFAIAGLQVPVISHGDNVQALSHRIDACMAKYPWVQMIVLSELAAHGPLHNPEPADGPTETAFRRAAGRHGIWLVPGSYFELADDGKIYNTAPVLDPAGNVVTRVAVTPKGVLCPPLWAEDEGDDEQQEDEIGHETKVQGSGCKVQGV